MLVPSGLIIPENIKGIIGNLKIKKKNEDVISFFSALKKAGYDKRLSIEGKTSDFITDGPKALKVLKETYMEVYNG